MPRPAARSSGVAIRSLPGNRRRRDHRPQPEDPLGRGDGGTVARSPRPIAPRRRAHARPARARPAGRRRRDRRPAGRWRPDRRSRQSTRLCGGVRMATATTRAPAEDGREVRRLVAEGVRLVADVRADPEDQVVLGLAGREEARRPTDRKPSTSANRRSSRFMRSLCRRPSRAPARTAGRAAHAGSANVHRRWRRLSLCRRRADRARMAVIAIAQPGVPVVNVPIELFQIAFVLAVDRAPDRSSSSGSSPVTATSGSTPSSAPTPPSHGRRASRKRSRSRGGSDRRPC